MLTRPEVATLALFAEGGESAAVGTEDVAIRAETIAPGMFSWQKYRDRIDKELVRVALSDARLKAGFVIGSHAKGWMLTPHGSAFARQAAVKRTDALRAPKRRGEDDERIARERRRLYASDAFAAFQSGGSDAVTDDDADGFFRLNVYVQGDAREKKIARIENLFGDDPGLRSVIRALAIKARERALS